MAGLAKWFSNDSSVLSHMMRDPETHSNHCLSMASPPAGLFSLLFVCEKPSQAVEGDAVRAVTHSNLSAPK